MTRKDDLEQLIRDDYQIIHEFERILQYSEEPLEKRRSQVKIAERWELIRGHLTEYQSLCKQLGAVTPQDILEIAFSLEQSDVQIDSSKEETVAAIEVDARQTSKVSEGAPQQERLIKLHQMLLTRLDEEELRTLCFYSNVDYDGLQGKGKEGKIRELIRYFDRRSQIAQFVQAGKQLRPDIPWDECH